MCADSDALDSLLVSKLPSLEHPVRVDMADWEIAEYYDKVCIYVRK